MPTGSGREVLQIDFKLPKRDYATGAKFRNTLAK